MKKRGFALLAVSAVLSLSFLSSCNKKVDLSEFDIEFDNVSVDVATSGRYESFVDKTNAERNVILGELEEYAMKNNLTGLVLYDNGGYVKYSDRIVFPTVKISDKDNMYKKEQYESPLYKNVLGYGFGVLSEGKLNAPANVADDYKDYLRLFEMDNPNKLNQMDDNGSVVSSYSPYITSSYFDNRLAKSKEGLDGYDKYEIFPSLAKDINKVEGAPRPMPVGKDGNLIEDAVANKAYSKYRIYVRTEEDGLKYHIGGKLASSWNNKGVKIEDYETSIRQLHVKKNGLKRAADDISNAQAIKGMAAFYEATENGDDDAAWDKVGFKTGKDAKGSYVEYEFVTPCTPFFAQYYTGGSSFAPLPKAFVDEIGGIKNFAANGKAKNGEKLGIVDTALSTGPYIVEKWDDTEFVFKKAGQDAAVLGGAHRYQIPGVHVKIDAAGKENVEANWNEFQKGHYDSVGIPKTKLKEHRLKKGTQITTGDSTTKLNINTCDQETWNSLFGEQGSVTQTPKDKYYQCKPIMANADFIKGLSYSINRKEYATNHGVTPSIEYFSDNYMADPEKNISYNDTDAHNKAMTAYYGADWDDGSYGFNKQKAMELFTKAAKDLLAEGKYSAGQEIGIDIWWQAKSQIKNNGAELAKYIEDAWSTAMKAANINLKLKVNNFAVDFWMDVYEKKAMVGQFDIAFGGISGNPLNPLNFMEVLKSDNSSGFTLNWGTDTNVSGIDYNGKKYSYDGLYTAADTGALLDDKGQLAKTFDAKLVSNKHNDDGSRTIKFKVGSTNIDKVIKTSLTSVTMAWLDADEATAEAGKDAQVFKGDDLKFEDGCLVIKVDAETAKLYTDGVLFEFAFNQKFDDSLGGFESQKIVDINTYFPPKM